MASFIDYVGVPTILERVQRYPFPGEIMYSESDLIEWLGEAVETIGRMEMLVENYSIIQIENGSSRLPNMSRLLEVSMSDTKEILADVGNDEFCTLSYKIQKGVIYTSFEEGELYIKYMSMPLDEEGMPLIPNNEMVIKACEAFVLERIGYKSFMAGRLSGDKLTLLKRDKGHYIEKARNVLVDTSPAAMRNLQRTIKTPYIQRYNRYGRRN